MEAARAESPFSAEQVDDIPLKDAPLALVLAQIRWPRTTRISDKLAQVAGAFAEVVSDDYPLVDQKQETRILVTEQGVNQTTGAIVYQFLTADNSWILSLGETFLALETRQYTSHTDFCERLRRGLESLASVVTIPIVERVGFRYINRLDQEADLKELEELVEDHVLGGRAIPLARGAEMLHTVGEAAYLVDGSQLLVRSAQLPAGRVLDPTIEPVNSRSWILDIDASRTSRREYEPTTLADTTKELSRLAYKFFRWSVKPAFLRRFGA